MLLFVIHLCKNAVCGSWTFASGLWDADKTLWQRQVVLAPSPIPEFKTLVPRRTKEMPTLAGHLPTTAHCLYWIIIMCIYIWYMHVFVHVYAMIITIEICFYIFIHNQDCPHMSCFLGECKWPICFFWCLDPFVASVFLHIEIYPWDLLRWLRCSSVRFFAVLSWCRGCCNGRLVACQLRYCRRYVSTRGAASRHCHDGCSLAWFFFWNMGWFGSPEKHKWLRRDGLIVEYSGMIEDNMQICRITGCSRPARVL